MKYVFDISQSGDDTMIRLSGDLTIKNIAEIARDLTKIPGRNVTIELNDPAIIDLSFLQVLVNIIDNLSHRGSNIRIKSALKDADLKLLENTGFSRPLQLKHT
jgi:anti-anti-sigma regulatory factor